MYESLGFDPMTDFEDIWGETRADLDDRQYAEWERRAECETKCDSAFCKECRTGEGEVETCPWCKERIFVFEAATVVSGRFVHDGCVREIP